MSSAAAVMARRILEPLCQSTKDLVSPIAFAANDRLEIRMGSNANEFDLQAYALLGNERITASRAASLVWYPRLQESKELGYGRRVCGATDFNVLIINSLWDRERITFGDENARATYDYLLVRFLSQTDCATRVAEFKLNGNVGEPPVGWSDHPEFPLAPYQLIGAWNGLSSEGYAYFMEQGTGKTPTSIAVMCHDAKLKHARTNEPYNCIIVCPKNVKFNWQRELAKFATVSHRSVVLRGGALHRMKQLIDIVDETDVKLRVVIVSYETLQRSWDALKMFEWDLGVADEAHMFKSPWSKRASAMTKLRERCNRRLALTGTPVTGSLLDFYYPLEWLGEGMSGFVSWKEFRSYYNKYAEEAVDNYQGAKVLIGFQNLPMLHERLSRCSFSITKKEAMPSLPDKMPSTLEASMGKKQAEVYKQVATQLAAEIGDALTDDASSMTVNNVLTKLLRLSQITSGYAVVDAEFNDDGEPIKTGADRIKWFDEVPKMDLLIEELKAKGPDDKSIVWACWVPVIKRLSERLTAEGIDHVVYYGGVSEADRTLAEERFNKDPKCKVFIGNPAAGGVGMNLPGYDASKPDEYTTNASSTYYYACNWSFTQRSQSEDRNHGKGRNRMPINVIDILVPGTIDVEILDRLSTKKQIALEAKDVRIILERLVNFDQESSED